MDLIKFSRDNRQKAWLYFVSIGQIPWDAKPREYVLHHIDETLKHNNFERYILWLPEDLVVMTSSEHSKFHNARRKLSEEHKQKISAALKGKPSKKKGIPMSEEQKNKISETMKGRIPSEETRKKISDAKKGQPSGTKGKHWKLENGKRVYYNA